MAKNKDISLERRKYIRLPNPIKVSYSISGNNSLASVVTKNISADGFRFEAHDAKLSEDSLIEIKLDFPETTNPVHANGRVVWKKKISLEDRAPFDFGIEFTEVEEDNKNTFLKFFCDLLYKQGE